MEEIHPVTLAHMNNELERLKEHYGKKRNWLMWGPYLSGRAWGTMRENYNGDLWWGLSHDQSRSVSYRWGEDGILGISDEHQYLCFAISMWNGKDKILKERLFGLTNPEGNHGEDIKERVFYLEGSPTHSYLSGMYSYPQDSFPYDELVSENANRGLYDVEYELVDTGIFEDNRYFEIKVEYAKADENDIFIKITATNRGNESAPLWLIPTLWFRNSWDWGYPTGPKGDTTVMPNMKLDEWKQGPVISTTHPVLGNYNLYAQEAREVIFTNNSTNMARLTGKSQSKKNKDAFHRYIVDGQKNAVDKNQGTKAGLVYQFENIKSGASKEVWLRLTPSVTSRPFGESKSILVERKIEADNYIKPLLKKVPREITNIVKQAWAGLVWTKQWYYLDMDQWLSGDPNKKRNAPLLAGNQNWRHLKHDDVMLVPDHWEYPWYAAWDLAFHTVSYADLDLEFAKKQLEIMVKSRVMHPNGQIPAYENEFDAVNPPVIAWAVWKLFLIGKENKQVDVKFLEKMFGKLLLNFGWWVNKKDAQGKNVFQGGFLGLDNIGIFDRNLPIPGGGLLDQADGTSWMAQYTLVMFRMAVELGKNNDSYHDLAEKFLRHFMMIVDASTHIGNIGVNLWSEHDGFFYDVLHTPDGQSKPLPVRSIVGLMPMIASLTLAKDELDSWEELRPLIKEIKHEFPLLVQDGHLVEEEENASLLLSMASEVQIKRLLRYMLDSSEFLSLYGIRSLSKYHEVNPVGVELGGQWFSIDYQPGESKGAMFGGNSNWRGPIWFPINYLLIDALRIYHKFFGDNWKVEFPANSGQKNHLGQIADALSERLLTLFVNEDGDLPPSMKNGQFPEIQFHPELLWFYEYFHGDNGRGLGASHQTGWTALIARLMREKVE